MRVPRLAGPRRTPAAAARGTRASLGVVVGRRSGTAPARSYSTPLCTTSVASPPSSRIMFGPLASPSAASAAHARCTTSTPRASRPSTRTPGCPRAASAAAAWSWVEKMLHDAQRTSAPSAISVSISTAVWIVMCSEPVMRAPASGCVARVALAQRHEAGHLVLGELDLLAAEVGERQVGDLEVGGSAARRVVVVAVRSSSSRLLVDGHRRADQRSAESPTSDPSRPGSRMTARWSRPGSPGDSHRGPDGTADTTGRRVRERLQLR